MLAGTKCNLEQEIRSLSVEGGKNKLFRTPTSIVGVRWFLGQCTHTLESQGHPPWICLSESNV